MFKLKRSLIRNLNLEGEVGSRSTQRVFCIGDIHGCAGELQILIDHLQSSKSLSQEDLVIFLGDYIDRGPESREVISLLLRFRSTFPHTIFLRGNHEDAFLDFVGLGGSYGWAWLPNGGTKMLSSYGIDPSASSDEILRLMPEDHLIFLSELEFGVELAEYIVVHAGINPNRAIHHQSPDDILWIREKFLYSSHNLGKLVVFGHTFFEHILLDLPYKIGIDTGLVYGNKLSCIELNERLLIEVKRWGTSAVETILS